MLCAKPQLLTDSFHFPKRGAKNKKQKSGKRAERSKKPKAPKDPKPKRTPLAPRPGRKDSEPVSRRNSRTPNPLGLCRHCPEPAIEGQTRCQQCAERHRARRREDDSRRRARSQAVRGKADPRACGAGLSRGYRSAARPTGSISKGEASEPSIHAHLPHGGRTPSGTTPRRKENSGRVRERATREAQGVRSMQGLQGERDTRTDPLRDMRRKAQGGAPTERRREEKKGGCLGPRGRRNSVRRRSARSAASARSTAGWQRRTRETLGGNCQSTL